MAPLETPPSVLRYEGHIVGEGKGLHCAARSRTSQPFKARGAWSSTGKLLSLRHLVISDPQLYPTSMGV